MAKQQIHLLTTGGTIAMQNRSDIDPTLTGTVVSIELPVREAPRLG